VFDKVKTRSGGLAISNWTLHTYPVRGYGEKKSAIPSCDSAVFSVESKLYYKVCGRILAYQKRSRDDLDGVSITLRPIAFRQHIWTFAAAHYKEDPSCMVNVNCP